MLPFKDLFVSPRLTNISLAYKNTDYIAKRILPVITVQQDAGQIVSYGADNLRIVNSLRAPGARAKVVSHTISAADHFLLGDHVLEGEITKEEYDNAADPIDPEIDETENVTDRILVEAEKAVADALSSTSVMILNDTLSGTDQWDDPDSTPVDDILAGKNAMKAACGMRPNTMIIAENAWEVLKVNNQIMERNKYALQVTDEVLNGFIGRAFPGITNIIVGSAMFNDADEGDDTPDLQEIWDRVCILAYIAPKPTLKSRSLGYTYQRATDRMQTRILRMDSGSRELFSSKKSVVQVTDKYDQVLVDTNCGYLIKDCIAA